MTRIDRATGPGPRGPRAAGWAVPPGWPAGDQFFDRQPTPEEEMFAEIVAEDRDRSLGAILLDICLDLGIAPALMDPSTWDELRLAITLYGGDPATLEARGMDSAERKSEAHSATGTPGPNGNPPAAGQPTIVYPPWPAPPDQPPPSEEESSLEADRWGRGPGP